MSDHPKGEDFLTFITNTDPISELKELVGGEKLPWNVLIVDDDDLIHSITLSALKYFTFLDRKLQIFQARSKQEAIKIFERESYIALILLDVVMEEEHAGLDFVNYVRNIKNNQIAQIILRTGQPGKAPEESVMRDYKIGSYLLKSETNETKIKSHFIGGLRAYQELFNVGLYRGMRQRLRGLFKGSDDEVRSKDIYEDQIFEELCDVIGMSKERSKHCSAIYGYVNPYSRKPLPDDPEREQKLGYTWDVRPSEMCTGKDFNYQMVPDADKYDGRIDVLATLGKYRNLVGYFPTPPEVKQAIGLAHAQQKSIYDKNFIILYYFNTKTVSKYRGISFLYLENFPDFDRNAVEFYFDTLREILTTMTGGFL